MIANIPKHWKIKKLGDVLEIFPTASYSRSELSDEGEMQYIHYGDIHTKFDSLLEITDNTLPKISKSKGEKYETIQLGDLVMVDASEDYQGVGKSTEVIALSRYDTIAGLHTFLLRDKGEYFCLGYKGYITMSDYVKKQLYIAATGTKVYSLSKESLKLIQLPIPPLKEQEKITEILLSCDKAIRLTTQIITQLKQRNQGLAQQLLTGEKSNYKAIGKYIKEISNRNSILQVKKVLSVTNSKGFINQSEQFGRELASSDVSNYKIVSKGQFAYNPSRVNVGSIDLLQDSEMGILSPMYIVFETKEDHLLSKFLYYHLKSNSFLVRIPTYVQGSVRDTLSFKALSEMEFFIPNIEKQKKVTKILDTAHQELKLYEQKLQLLQAQKKTLMQKLLTGEVLTVKK